MMRPIKTLSPSDASQLHTAMADDPYGTPETQRIKSAIDEKVESSPAAVAHPSRAKGKQVI